MTDLQKAKLAAEAASVEVAVAARNEEIRMAIALGMSLRDIEATTGIPRSTVQRIGAATPLTEAQYLRLANAEVMARAEVAAFESVSETIANTDSKSA